MLIKLKVGSVCGEGEGKMELPSLRGVGGRELFDDPIRRNVDSRI